MLQKFVDGSAANKSGIAVGSTDELIVKSLARLDQTALGVALGVLLGGAVFLATNILVFKGGEVVGPNLVLLNQYFIGYTVTLGGSLLGLFYGFISGFILGWMIAFLRNSIIAFYLGILKFRQSMLAVNDFIDNP